ncbi:glycosyltransferase family 4 protein [Paenibacillus roseipurpureus]|uniref:Glycosyltransferase family 4 protein n=1 Tax=Paenibacillus roseopurpureus TaxID=2918901 RepID=A0AA96LS33_9BACL|nr:glycosyltransferase family 4 protein [Paenibacillus sp. MBLB1832]WNR46229.1 glycosyltransferase family 4 protein [Paenibacillus sp. MBLB1832]
MNILMICTEKLPVPNIRGGAIQTYICGVASLLRNHHTITILGRTDPDLPNDEVRDGIRYVRVDSEGLLEPYTTGVVGFLANTKEHYDLIQIYNRPLLVLPVRSVAPTSRIILSMHNDMFTPAKLPHNIGTEVLEQTERIITISNYVGHSITDYYPQAAPKLKTIYSGVDLDRFAPWMESASAKSARESIRAEYNLSNKKVILFVGRLTRNKGPHVLVRAMSEINHSDAVLVVVGGAWFNDNTVSDYVAYVRALADRSPLPVITTGYVQAHDIHRWFCAGDVFVCTSIWQEPLARVHYEAMAAGLPFLTSARGGNPEIVMNNNGVLVNNPEDPNEYAQKLNSMLSNVNNARQMGINGRRLAEKNFTWHRVAQEILAVWAGH